MRALKVTWYGLMAALLFMGLVTGRREFFLLFAVMGFVALYAFALNLWTILSFSYVQKLKRDACVKGAAAALEVSIHNEKPFPFSLIRVDAARVDGAKTQLRFSLLPGSHIDFTVPLDCPYRGVYEVGMTTLEVNDCFGLVRTRFDMRWFPYYRQPKLKIYPRLAVLPALPARWRDAKALGGRAADQGEAFAGLRAYRPGDAFKRVHRAASTKRGEWLVKTYDAPFDKSAVAVCLDTAIDGAEDGRFLADLACECAAAVAHYNLRVGYQVALHCGGEKPQFFDSMRDFPRLYNLLAELPFGAQTPAEPPSPDARAVYVISPRADYGCFTANGDVTRILLSARPNGGLAGEAFDDTALRGARVVRVSLGDDVAAALGGEAGL